MIAQRARKIFIFWLQIGLVIAANFTAFALRFEGQNFSFYEDRFIAGLPFVLGAFVLGMYVFGIQRGLWRYTGLHDLNCIFKAALISTIFLYLIMQWVSWGPSYPRSVIILTGFLSGVFLVVIRLGVRWVRGYLQEHNPGAKRVLIVGAGSAGELFVRDIQNNPSCNYRLLGLVDDDPLKQNMRIHGVPVLGGIADLAKLSCGLGAQEIVVAIPSASNILMQKIIVSAVGCNATIKILPSVKQLLANPSAMRQIRPMKLDDLLQRDIIQMDQDEFRSLFQRKVILVTGAGGSIGSELCRQIACYGPASLVLFDRNENGLATLLLELQATCPQLHVYPVVGDVTIPDSVVQVFRRTRPDIVFHAAAYKHVPLMEFNAKEAVRNNVWGTRVMVEAAMTAGVSRFVLISTDKAVKPSSVMGATKRIAEHLIRRRTESALSNFTVVRFGNVLGSNGSVVPLFAQQIEKGGPVTVTDPEMKRFFMTIPEAVQLVLQASVMGKGGEVFVLNMGEQVKITDLAKSMIVLSGLVPGKDIEIVYTGLRPGEKLYEELFEQSEVIQATAHSKINCAVEVSLRHDRLDQWILELPISLLEKDEEAFLKDLKEFFPTIQSVVS